MLSPEIPLTESLGQHTQVLEKANRTSEDSLQLKIERLGRERPTTFPTQWSEICFVFSIAMSQFLTEYFVSGFTVILPTLIIELDIPQAASVWPATAFSLVIASTLLVFGRLGDMWGGYPIFLAGIAWLLVWSIVAGFSTSPLMLDLCRALQGLGAAAFLPTGVMLMGSIYRPGPRKNLVFAIYGTSAVLGFFGGIFVAGVVGQYLRWGYYFWIGGLLAAITLLASILSVPRSRRSDTTNVVKVKMDYAGAATIVTGLVLVVFAITESAHAPLGWHTPYIPITFVLGIASLLAATWIEIRVAIQPLLPSSLFTTPRMTPLLLALLLLYGTWGIYSVYGTLFFQTILGASPLQVVAWYTPLVIVGLLISILEGLILHLVPGRILLLISGAGAMGSQLLLAFLPAGGGSGGGGSSTTYWAYILPAMILSTIGIDLSIILLTVYITTALPTAQQGLAGGVINSVLQLGVALVLGVADIIQSATVDDAGVKTSYRSTFWLGVAAGAVALLLFMVWGGVPRAGSEMTVEERGAAAAVAAGGVMAANCGGSDTVER